MNLKFSDFDLNKKIIKAVSELGFEEPTRIQEEVIPFLLQTKTDLVGLAQTGTGKTAAFGLPLLQKIDPDKKEAGQVSRFQSFSNPIGFQPGSRCRLRGTWP